MSASTPERMSLESLKQRAWELMGLSPVRSPARRSEEATASSPSASAAVVASPSASAPASPSAAAAAAASSPAPFALSGPRNQAVVRVLKMLEAASADGVAEIEALKAEEQDALASKLCEEEHAAALRDALTSGWPRERSEAMYAVLSRWLGREPPHYPAALQFVPEMVVQITESPLESISDGCCSCLAAISSASAARRAEQQEPRRDAPRLGSPSMYNASGTVELFSALAEDSAESDAGLHAECDAQPQCSFRLNDCVVAALEEFVGKWNSFCESTHLAFCDMCIRMASFDGSKRSVAQLLESEFVDRAHLEHLLLALTGAPEEGDDDGDDDVLPYVDLSDPDLMRHISTGLGRCAFRSRRLLERALLAAEVLEERAQVEGNAHNLSVLRNLHRVLKRHESRSRS